MADGLSKEFLNERDFRIFQMRKAGTPTSEIARRFGITPKAVNLAVQRQLTRMNAEAALAYPELLRMELERLDSLQQALWPLTQHRKLEVDGEEVMLEPDQKAITTVLSIMDKRARLLGMGTTTINLDIQQDVPARAVLADAADRPAAVNEFDPETEAKRLIELMLQAGVLPPAQAEMLLGQPLALDAAEDDYDDEEEYDAVIVPDEVIP